MRFKIEETETELTSYHRSPKPEHSVQGGYS